MMENDILRAELERLFDLDELLSLSRDLLGFEPDVIGDTFAKAPFARALTAHCVEHDAIEALCDALLAMRVEVSNAVEGIRAYGLTLGDELAPGQSLGEYQDLSKLSEGELAIAYLGRKEDANYRIQVLRREVARDRRGVHRLATLTRLLSAIEHPLLPKQLGLGNADGRVFIAHRHVPGHSLGASIEREGALHFSDARETLRGILAALAALHERRVVHGNLGLETVLLSEGSGAPVLLDAGFDRLNRRTRLPNGAAERVDRERNRSRAPEQIRGLASKPQSDVYAFGVLMFAMLTGKPLFDAAEPLLVALGHLSEAPRAPSAVAPRSSVPAELDDFVLSLLAKDPNERPENAIKALEAFDKLNIGRRSAPELNLETLEALSERLRVEPNDAEALFTLEESGTGSELADQAGARLLEAARGGDPTLFLRAARVFASRADTRERAEAAYLEYLEREPTDQAARTALLELRRRLGKYEEVLEMLLENAENAASPDARARAFSEIAQLYTSELKDTEQALVAITQAFLEEPHQTSFVIELERLAGTNLDAWKEVLETLDAAVEDDARDVENRTLIANRLGTWWAERGERPELGVLAFKKVLGFEPGNQAALDGLTRIYRRAQQWAELAPLLVDRAKAAATPGLARDLYTDAAEIYETHLADTSSARALYEQVVAEDPTHTRASTRLAAIYQGQKEFPALIQLLEGGLAGKRGEERTQALCRIAAVYEEELDDSGEAARRFQAVLEQDPTSVEALRGLERAYTRQGQFRELVANLERQVELAATPRQKISLLERAAQIEAEEFLDPARAAEFAERILALDPSHRGALEQALRHARTLERWDEVARLLERQTNLLDDEPAKIRGLLELGRIQREHLGSPDLATRTYEAVLALDRHEPKALAAIAALRETAGDTDNAINALETLAQKAENPEAAAEHLGRASRILVGRGGVADTRRAEEVAKRALALDATNLDALRTLADAAFVSERYVEAIKHYEALVARAPALEKERRVELFSRYAEALARTGSTEQALEPLERLLELAPGDTEVLERAASVVFAYGEPARAAELYTELVGLTRDREDSERSKLLYFQGESLRRSGRLEEAERALMEAIELAGTSTEPLIALAKVHELQERWEDVLKVKLRHLDLTTSDERLQLLLDTSEIASTKLDDRARAAKMLVAALDERPDDRRLLTRLMQLYSESKDWNQLVDVVLRLAEFVDDPKQRVKYLHTAAIVTARQIGDTARALEFYDQVLALEPSFDKAIAEAIELRRSRGDHGAVEALLQKRLTLATESNDTGKLVETFDQLAELYEKQLGSLEKAIDASEAAHTLDPSNPGRRERLRGLYASEPPRYLDKAVANELALLHESPYDAAPYRALRRLYTEAKRPDEAWCLCQALSVQNLAEPDEERFYKRMRSETAAPAEQPLDEEDWLGLMHPDADPLLTSVFALIEPAVITRRSASLAEFGYDESMRLELADHPAPVCQSLYYASVVLGIPLPPSYENIADRSGISLLLTPEPSLALGTTALRQDVPLRLAAFIAGQKLASVRAGLYVEKLLDTGTALKAWLFGAIKLTAPAFPVAVELEGVVNEALAALEELIQGQARDHLTRAVAQLLTSGAALDLKRWASAIELTADRAGFLLAHDLATAIEFIRASEETASLVPIESRVKELLLYAVSPEYLKLRRKLKISVDA